MVMSKAISRRGLLAGGAALVGASCLPDVGGQWSDRSSALCNWTEPSVAPGDPAHAGRVVELHDEALLDGFAVNAAQAGDAVSKVLLALTNKPDLRSAWQVLIPSFAAGQIIGIKVNALSNRVPTSPALVKGLIDSIKTGLQIPGAQIVVWDRRLDELEDAGFTAEALGVTVEATLETAAEKGAGRGYELGATCIGGQNTHLSQILTRRLDHLINFSVMKNHKASGFTGCMKNHYGLIDNPGEFHDVKQGELVLEHRFNPAIPDINALHEVVSKTRLWLMDSVVAVCRGDTSDPADCFPARLLASLDPVAIDARGKQIRDDQRGPKLGPNQETISEKWLRTAEKYGLGKLEVDTNLI